MPASTLRDSLSDQGSIGGGGRNERQRVLIVEDDTAMARTLECYFANRELVVVEAATIGDAKRLYGVHAAWSLVISDFHLPDGNGWDFCCWIRRQSTEPTPFLLISGAPNATGYATQVEFLAKPFSIAQLDCVVGKLLGAPARQGSEVGNQSEA
jgi:DNA-binding response OmpR family regulator